MKTVIVGGVAGGASAAARLRRLDEHAQIVLFERGEYISFANCGLPYYISGTIAKQSDLTLQTPESFHKRFAVDVRIQSEVVCIHPQEKTVEVLDHKGGKTYTESYDKLILAPGAMPVLPPIPGADLDRVFTLRTIPDTLRIKAFVEEKKPRRAVVIGGGFIGLELAENLKNAGLDVTIAELSDHVIAPLDYDMASVVHSYLESKGLHLLLGRAVNAITEKDGALAVQLDGCELGTDMVVLSVGVRPESKLARDAGLLVNDIGAVVTDNQMRTSDSDIYAVGDVTEADNFMTGGKSYVPLAGPANKQGRIAADNICGIESTYTGTQGSAVIQLFDMTIACTGLNERAARAANADFETSVIYSPSHATYYPDARNMFIKILFEKQTGRLLGAQLAGFEGVDKRCDVFATAIRAGMTVDGLTHLELCYAPPYSSAKDPVNMAGFAAQNILHGLVQVFHWQDVASLPRDGSVTLLDVRTPTEHARGSIDGFVNLPLDSLRDRLDTLDPDKPVYVHCQSGLRSYIACRILTQNGFTCFNLSGGYVFYSAVVKDNSPDPAQRCLNVETQQPQTCP